MALQNHPAMYSLGAVELNSQPSVNIYALHLQRKQAREEALDQYELNRMNRINEAGVRDIDREGLDRQVLEMKGYYQANKDRIRRGGTPEAYNYEKMFRDTLGGISKSKDASARSDALMKLRAERLKYGRSTPEDWFEDLRKHEETPIWDEGYSPLELTKYSSQGAPKYNPKAVLDLVKDVKRVPSMRFEDVPGDKYSRLQFIDESFDDAGKNTISVKAAELYDIDDGFAAEVQQDVSNPMKRGQLEKTFTEQYGTTPQSMSDYAVAKVMQQVQPKITGKPKIVPKWEDRTRLLQQFKQANMAVINSYRQLDRANQDFFIDSIIDDNLLEAQKTGGEFQASPLVLKTLGQFNIPAEKMRATPDGNFEYLFDGKWHPLGANTYKAHLRDIFQAKATAPQIKKGTETKKPTKVETVAEKMRRLANQK
jgi:hypothetical protein